MSGKNTIRWIGFFLGPLLFVCCFAFLPSHFIDEEGTRITFSTAGRTTLAIGVWIAIWWLSETIHISATALLPLALFPVLQVTTFKETASAYSHPFIFLFMGGFLIALSMQRWKLDRRIALLTLRTAGTSPRRMIAGFMIATAALSAFVSNTATAAMMLPIALSIVQVIRGARKEDSESTDRFATCLMLCIAYAASIGGVATIIGTPPNAFLAGFLEEKIAEPHQLEISFIRWMCFGVPATLILLPLTWLLLTYVLFPVGNQSIEGGKELIDREIQALGKPSSGEIITFIVFISTAILWMARPTLTKLTFNAMQPLAGLSDSGIAMLAAITLFIVPVDLAKRTFTLDWETARKLPWGILILFGGGLALAAAVQSTGVGEFLASQTASLSSVPPLLIVIAVTAGIVFLTELTSNAATAATFIPVLAGMAGGLGVHPYLLIFPATMAASCAFMLPVATPPNAIVYGSGDIEINQMIRAGFWLNLISIVLLSILSYMLVPLLFVSQ